MEDRNVTHRMHGDISSEIIACFILSDGILHPVRDIKSILEEKKYRKLNKGYVYTYLLRLTHNGIAEKIGNSYKGNETKINEFLAGLLKSSGFGVHGYVNDFMASHASEIIREYRRIFGMNAEKINAKPDFISILAGFLRACDYFNPLLDKPSMNINSSPGAIISGYKEYVAQKSANFYAKTGNNVIELCKKSIHFYNSERQCVSKWRKPSPIEMKFYKYIRNKMPILSRCIRNKIYRSMLTSCIQRLQRFRDADDILKIAKFDLKYATKIKTLADTNPEKALYKLREMNSKRRLLMKKLTKLRHV